MRILLNNIHSLCGLQPAGKTRLAGEDIAVMPSLEDSWLLVEAGKIAAFGEMKNLPDEHADQTIDCDGRLVLPAFVDSHTHLVFAAARDEEFVMRIKGESYEEIAAAGGGILNSAAKLGKMSENQLYDQALPRLHQVVSQGTGAIEIKSGYGLDLENELKMLRVIRRLREENVIPVKASFLAAHAYPPLFRDNHEGYLRLIIDEMLPRVADEGLADYMDAFCELGFFEIDEVARLLEAAAKYGLQPKIHANQLHHSGGVEVGIEHGALSVDHLECVGEAEITALKNSNTIPTLLPGAAFFLGMHYQPARLMLDAGLSVCLASDYNPGSCPSGNMQLLATIACTQMKMTPAEAINSMTLNGAAALEMAETHGSITIGKAANLIITTKMNSLNCIPYDYGNNNVYKMMVDGKLL